MTNKFPFTTVGVTAAATTLIMLSSVGYYLYRRMIHSGGEKKKIVSMFVCTTCSIGKRIGDGSDKIPTGPSMFRGIVEKLFGIKDADLKETFNYSTKESEILIRPHECLGACKQANSIALSCPTKYSYHFSMLETVEDIEDIISFTRWYADDVGNSYTKKAGRPGKLGPNCVSRIPPSIHSDVNNK